MAAGDREVDYTIVTRVLELLRLPGGHHDQAPIALEGGGNVGLGREAGEGGEVHRHDGLRIEILPDGERRGLRVLDVWPAADVEQDDAGVVDLLDQGHVAEDPGVAGVVEGSPVGEGQDEADRPAARCARVHGGHQVHGDVADGERPADVPAQLLRAGEVEG